MRQGVFLLNYCLTNTMAISVSPLNILPIAPPGVWVQQNGWRPLLLPPSVHSLLCFSTRLSPSDVDDWWLCWCGLISCGWDLEVCAVAFSSVVSCATHTNALFVTARVSLYMSCECDRERRLPVAGCASEAERKQTLYNALGRWWSVSEGFI